MAPSDFAAVFGLEDPDTSIPAIEQLTQKYRPSLLFVISLPDTLGG